MSRSRALARNFWHYQSKRFPVILLALVLLPAVLSSGAVVLSSAPPGFVLLALVASVAFMLHLRILDDFRDSAHDGRHHPERPLVAGAISRRELAVIDRIAVLALVGSSLLANLQAAAIAVFMLGFAFLAGRDFFAGDRLRRHFFAYNALNMVHMGFLQVLVYHLASGDVRATPLVVLHFLFTATGSVIVEVLRKVKPPGEDGTGRDTYTWHLGFPGALQVYTALLGLNVLFFLALARGLSVAHGSAIAAAAGALALLSIFHNCRRRTRLSNQLMQLGFLLAYGGLNIALYAGTWQ
jgi:4-hydroxybenzoate polyprenyltransferase